MIVAAFSAATGLAMGLVGPAKARRIFFVWLATLAMLLAVVAVSPDPKGAFNGAVVMAVVALPLSLLAGWLVGMAARRFNAGRSA